MSILEFVEARQEHDRTKQKSVKCPPSISMEPGEELLRNKCDEVLRIMRWFIDRKRTRASVAFVGGEDELIQASMLYLLRFRPKTPISLATRVCHCVMWAQGKMIYEINRFDGKHEIRSNLKKCWVVDSEFDRVDKQDLEQFFWRKCAHIVKSDRQFQILFRWWKLDVDQTVIAEEQGVTRQMISLLMKQAEKKLLAKKSELDEVERLMFERKR